MEDLLDGIVAIADAFDRAEVPHSFGGAIALGYYATARATHDIDINIYLEVEDAERALVSLQALGVPAASEGQRTEIRRSGQTRLHWGKIPLDLFFSNLDFHESCRQRRRQYPLLDHTIYVLSPEDLIICKVAFGRDKDTRDISHMLDTVGAGLDVSYVLHWVETLVGGDTDPARELASELTKRSLAPTS